MVDLIVGRNNILIEVTAEDGKATSVRNYFLVINRAAFDASDKADLMTNEVAFRVWILALQGITVSPGFDKDVTSYTTLVPNTATSVTVVETAS